MNIFSLSQLALLSSQLPDPRKALHGDSAYHAVIKLRIRDGEVLRGATHLAGEFEGQKEPFAEFEMISCIDGAGVITPRWILRGLVAI